MKLANKLVILIMITFYVLPNVTLLSNASNKKELVIIPVSDNFSDYKTSPENHGMLPSPLSFKSDSIKKTSYRSETLPSKYDSRDYAYVPEIRDQGTEGNCWAFSNICALETVLDPSQAGCDYSEQHMSMTLGDTEGDDTTFDYEIGSGGNRLMATAYMARWSGPVDEKAITDGQVQESYSAAAIKHVQNVHYIPTPNTESHYTADFEYRNRVKRNIQRFGAVSSAYGHYEEWYNPQTYGYCYDGNNNTSHAVALIGWDDNYSASNFVSTPKGDGAWIVRNSWSKTFGDHGYFYISYYDKLIGADAAAYPEPEEVDNYENIYQYDILGTTGGVTYNENEMWMANIFNASSANQLVEAISFYVLNENATYSVYVDNNTDNGTIDDFSDNGYLVQKTFDTPGYYTIQLPTPVRIRGKSFAVAAKISGISTVVAPIEHPLDGYSTKAKSERNQSFLRYGHQPWTDLIETNQNANTCIKAFTSAIPDLECELQVSQTGGSEITVQYKKPEYSDKTTGYLFITSGARPQLCSDIQIVPIFMSNCETSTAFTIPTKYRHVSVFLFEDPVLMRPLAGKHIVKLD